MSRQNVATYRIAGLAIYSFLLFGCGGGGTPTTPCNNLLSSLSISGATLAPAFSSGVTNYTATVPSSTNSVEVLPITSTPSCASFILRNRTGFGTIIALVVGDNTISIEVFVRTLPFLSTPIRLYTIVVTRSPFAQEAYIKASNTNAADRFGQSVAVSGDGNTLAVGADGEDSAATGVNGDQADNNAVAAGAVYVFTRDSGGVWTQQAYVKASITDADDGFGHSVALSGDGNTLVVGADGEDSAATGVNGDQTDNNAPGAGAVYFFTRKNFGSVWIQQAYIKASNTDASDGFGHSVALSGDDNRLAVGADGEDSAAIGVNGDQADNNASAAGAVYVSR